MVQICLCCIFLNTCYVVTCSRIPALPCICSTLHNSPPLSSPWQTPPPPHPAPPHIFPRDLPATIWVTAVPCGRYHTSQAKPLDSLHAIYVQVSETLPIRLWLFLQYLFSPFISDCSSLLFKKQPFGVRVEFQYRLLEPCKQIIMCC